jgi:hypothetical protein
MRNVLIAVLGLAAVASSNANELSMWVGTDPVTPSP